MSGSTHLALTMFHLVMVVGATAVAAPTYIRTSATEDPSTSFGIAWTTLSGTAEATVEYGTTKGSYPKSVNGKVTLVSPTLGSISEVELTGLSPATTYFYRVGGSAGGFSTEHTFRTAPKQDPQCGTLRFAGLGDSRAEAWQGDKGASDVWTIVSLAALMTGPDFMLHGGDIVHDGDKEKQWDNQLNVTSPISAVVPIMYAIGNHDTGPTAGDGANFNRVFFLPRADKALGGSGTEDYYFFTWGNAIFVSLSTETFSGGSIKFKQQADWLDQVLTQHPKRWRFVVLHRPIYTHRIDILGLDISHPPNEAGHNAAFVPVFNKHHVDIVFQSHNHFYERFVPSNCTNGGSTTPCPVGSFDAGTVYVTTGGAGAFPITCPFLCPGPVDNVRVAASSDHHYVLVEIKDHALTLEAINLKGNTIDTLKIAKAVPVPDPCAVPPPADAGPDALARDSTPVDSRPLDSRTEAAAPADSKGPRSDLQLSVPGNDGCGCRIAAGRAAPPGVRALLLLALAAMLVLRRRWR